jgi:hypothetical protein
MAKKGSPYLESGESLILTTDRISVNSVQYDMLLTTRYLILVDIRYGQFQPQMIPLLTIQSVKGGKTANGELVITLFFTETGSSHGSDSMVLLFSQQSFEQRKRERDDWLKTLMGLIVSARQETSYDTISTADPEIGIRPAKRRPISPEIPHPYTKIVETRPAQIELIIIPDEPESPVISEENQKISEMSFPGEKTETNLIPAPCAMEETSGASPELTDSPDILLTPVPVVGETATGAPELTDSPDTLLTPVPVVGETATGAQEAVSRDTATLVPAFEEIPVVVEADFGRQKSAAVSLLAAVKSLSSPQGRSSVPDTEFPPLPDSEETPGFLPEMTGLADMPLPPEAPDCVASSYVPEEKPEPLLPPATSTIEEKPGPSQDDIVSHDLPPSPEPVTVDFPAIPRQDSPCAEAVLPETGDRDEAVQQPDPEAIPPTNRSPPPSAGPGSRRLIFIAVAAIIIILLGITGVMVFYPQNPTAPVIEPTPGPTPTIQQAPQPTPVIIPPTGVWVRVGYPRSYYGWVGNAGSIRGINGSGDQIYKIPETEGIVQVQMYKPDNSGDILTVQVYRDGEVISLRNVSTPMGSIELLIDAKTGLPPAMTPAVTPSGNQTGSNAGRIMYF